MPATATRIQEVRRFPAATSAYGLLRKVWLPARASESVVRGLTIAWNPADTIRRVRLARRLGPAARQVSESAGYVLFPPGDLPGQADAIAAAERIFRERIDPRAIESEQLASSKKFLATIWRERQFFADPEILRFAISRSVLDLAIRYLGEVPVLSLLRLWWTPPNDSAIQSQLYHRDAADARQLKFFFNVRDVKAETGPTTFIPAAQSAELIAKFGRRNGRIADADLERAGGLRHAIALTGPGGSGRVSIPRAASTTGAEGTPWGGCCSCFNSRARAHRAWNPALGARASSPTGRSSTRASASPSVSSPNTRRETGKQDERGIAAVGELVVDGGRAQAGRRPVTTPLVDSDPLLHVGLHKTGTTWLQRHLFADPGRGFFAAAPAEARETQRSKAAASRLITGASGNLMSESEFDADAVRTELARIGVPQGLRAVVSSERLGGHPLSAGFDRAVLCRRLHAVFAKARILIVIRAQESILLSNYMQYLKYGGWHGIDRYLQPRCDGRQPALSLDFWRYDRLIELYRGEFGAERVLALPYEMLAVEAQEFARRICSFAGVAVPAGLPFARAENPRRSHFVDHHLRWLTAWHTPSSANGDFPSPFGRRLRTLDRAKRRALASLVPASLEERCRLALESRVRAIVGDTFRASNRRAQALTGIDLERLGYLV